MDVFLLRVHYGSGSGGSLALGFCRRGRVVGALVLVRGCACFPMCLVRSFRVTVTDAREKCLWPIALNQDDSVQKPIGELEYRLAAAGDNYDRPMNTGCVVRQVGFRRSSYFFVGWGADEWWR